MSRFKARPRFGTAALSFALAVGLATAVRAQGQAQPKTEPGRPPATVTGVVKGADGDVIGSVKVWLTGGLFGEAPRAIAETITNTDGSFSIVADPKNLFGAKLRPPALIARAADGRIGWAEGFWHRGEVAARLPVTIGLLPVGDFHGRIVDPFDKPTAGLRLQIAMLCNQEGNVVVLPQELREQAETDAEGRFGVHGLPLQGRGIAELPCSGGGRIDLMVKPTSPRTIMLDRTGTIRGRLQLPEGVSKVPPLEVQGMPSRSDDTAERADPGYHIAAYPSTDVNADGTFRLEGLPRGKYHITVPFDSEKPFYAEILGPVEAVPTASSGEVAVRVERAVRLQGRVVDQRTGAGVPGAEINVWLKIRWSTQRNGTATTDGEGRYSLFVKPGDISAFVSSASQPYVVSSRPAEPSYKNVTKDSTWPDIQLEPAKPVHGTVVDPSGKPVPDAKVYAIPAAADLPPQQQPVAKSDSEGRFSIPGLPTGCRLLIAARTDTAASMVTAHDPTKSKPLEVIVDAADASHFRGTLVRDAGATLANAVVEIWIRWELESSACEFMVERVVSGQDGSFASKALWPSQQYHLVASAPGTEQLRSADIIAEWRKDHDFGTLSLREVGRFVEGSVLDSAGKPIPDARVFNRGDGPRKATTQTDAQGHFLLTGLYSGPVWVFVEKEGWRFTGVRTQDGSRNVAVTLLRRGEPIPTRPAKKPPTAEEEREIARQLLERAWPISREPRIRQWLTRRMDRLAPEQAKKWRTEIGEREPDAGTKSAEPDLAKIAETDLDEALSLMAAMGDGDALQTLHSLAKKFRSSAPEKAARFAEEGLVRARAVDQPNRAKAIAELGELIVSLGQVEAGRKRIEEAAEMASNLAAEGDHGAVRGHVARLLAVYDLNRATALLQPMKDNVQRWHLCHVAVAVGVKDPQKGIELVSRLDKYYQNLVRKRIAYGLAAKDPGQAIRIVDEMKADGETTASYDQAEGFAWLATAIASHDRALACSLIDRALDLCQSDAPQFRYSGEGRCQLAAVMAVHADRIGYLDMESVVWRVLAARPASDHVSAIDDMRDLLRGALVLSAIDRQAACEILQGLALRKGLLGGDRPDDRDSRLWLEAWTLADLDHARILAEEKIADLRTNQNRRFWDTGLASMIEVLLMPRGERAKYLASETGQAWFPEED